MRIDNLIQLEHMTDQSVHLIFFLPMLRQPQRVNVFILLTHEKEDGILGHLALKCAAPLKPRPTSVVPCESKIGGRKDDIVNIFALHMLLASGTWRLGWRVVGLLSPYMLSIYGGGERSQLQKLCQCLLRSIQTVIQILKVFDVSLVGTTPQNPIY